MAFELSTLHIFGYGETQVIGQDGETSVNKKVASSSLTKLQAVVDDVYSHKPAENPATIEYRAINIFNNLFSDFQPKEGKGFRVPFEELNKVLIDELVIEVLATPEPAAI